MNGEAPGLTSITQSDQSLLSPVPRLFVLLLTCSNDCWGLHAALLTCLVQYATVNCHVESGVG